MRVCVCIYIFCLWLCSLLNLSLTFSLYIYIYIYIYILKLNVYLLVLIQGTWVWSTFVLRFMRKQQLHCYICCNSLSVANKAALVWAKPVSLIIVSFVCIRAYVCFCASSGSSRGLDILCLLLVDVHINQRGFATCLHPCWQNWTIRLDKTCSCLSTSGLAASTTFGIFFMCRVI